MNIQEIRCKFIDGRIGLAEFYNELSQAAGRPPGKLELDSWRELEHKLNLGPQTQTVADLARRWSEQTIDCYYPLETQRKRVENIILEAFLLIGIDPDGRIPTR